MKQFLFLFVALMAIGCVPNPRVLRQQAETQKSKPVAPVESPAFWDYQAEAVERGDFSDTDKFLTAVVEVREKLKLPPDLRLDTVFADLKKKSQKFTPALQADVAARCRKLKTQ